MFPTIDDLITGLEGQAYIADRRVATVAFLAVAIEKPLLVEGPAGVGKTELARALAGATGRELVRLQCYEGLDEAKAIYEWEYAKQLLYTQVLRERIGEVIDPADDLRAAAAALRAHEDVFFSEGFLVERPILRVVRSKAPTVLLIDEIDRADEELEALLLEFLADHQVTIPELGTLRAKATPIVVLTSNRTRELSEALKRRCLHLQLEHPDAERELRIVRARAPEAGEELAGELVRVVRSLRELDLRKAPSIAETLDWARALVALNAPELTRDLIEETLGVIVKHDRDREKVLAHIGAVTDDGPDERLHHDRLAPPRAHETIHERVHRMRGA